MVTPTASSSTTPGNEPGPLLRQRLARCLELRHQGWIALVLIALAPVFFVLLEAAQATRNIPYWDEFDTALAYVIRLDDGVTPVGFLKELFALNNEHRMVTSRLITAGYYWATGTVNFSFLSLTGNATIVLLCLLLVAAAGTLVRRVRIAVLLAFLLFHLGHYENFLWSGSSIDHFQVVLLAGAAVIALARGSTAGVVTAGALALLATFTLTHGFMIWPVGTVMLALHRRWTHAGIWLGMGALTTVAFFLGFEVNAAHKFAGFSLTGIANIVHYWLRLLGSALAVNSDALSPWLGVILLSTVVWLATLGFWRREPIAFWLVCLVAAALGAIAVGRTTESGGIVHSRYHVLSGVGWAMVGFMLLEQWSRPRRPFRLLLRILPLLIAFNVLTTYRFGPRADLWIEGRDRAAARFQQLGVDGKGTFRLYPVPDRSTQLLNETERRGLYRMPALCGPRVFSKPKPSARIVYYVDEMTVSPRSAFIGGWAAIRGVPSRRDNLHVVLHSETATHVFATLTATRPDVANAEKGERWLHSGFRFVRRREQLPAGEYQLGFLITTGDGPEYIMTAHRLNLTGEGKALLATGG